MLRLLGYLFGLGVVGFLIVAAGIAIYVGDLTDDLPDYEVLARYEPPVTTRFYSVDGRLMGEFARERRLFLPIQAVPDRVKAAFLSAEDKNFYSHTGVDFLALARAMVTNAQIVIEGQDRRLLGGSTITQQVAKNFLLSSDRTIDRKVKEAILAFRIEQAYTKDRILELYLNEIFFGAGSYGIAGAALTYFGKAVNELDLHEAAYLAALPKAPANYHPFDDTEAALDRRNWILDRMVDNGYITVEDAEQAKQRELGVNFRRSGDFVFASEYFTEEVRKQIIERYGDDALYEGGLSVRTTLDPKIQNQARIALQRGLLEFDRNWGWRGAIGQIDISGDWGPALAEFDRLPDVPEWDVAVVLGTGDDGVRIGLRPERKLDGGVTDERDEASIARDDMQWAFKLREDGGTRSAGSIDEVVAPGDVVYVQPKAEDSADYLLRQVPAVSGALVSMDPNTGRVLAMAGGFSFHESQFNRATQAYRQPGSSFKPFVYAAALDNGYTPASVIMDAPIKLVSGGEVWEPQNFTGEAAGPSTLRLGIEKSRNLMTVRLAQDMGMNLVAEYAEQFGLYDDLSPVLAMALGSGETTVLRMVSAYSVIANGGRQIEPALIDRIQDRYGRTVFKQDSRQCEGCNAGQWLGQDEPELTDTREIVLDPMTAYQMTSMMEGVVQRGTATILRDLGRPIAGKTGTTNDYKDAWFVGYTPSIVTGVYIGFDQPTEMGRGSTGGGLAAPVFKDFMADVLADEPLTDFHLPAGMNLIEIDRKTGMRANGQGGDIIIEAFKPGTGPADSYFVIGAEQVAIQVQRTERQRQISPDAQQAVQEGAGGLF
ncbi:MULTISPECIES: penicillin-binding protein 1A [unclassified Roseitalea]|uniref:penicillin-binding protein 1A n=1 Tax=unclassified Roseitalea TaxID=2639107 RepID=UPI00273FC8FD|nr:MULTISPECIES: penicillin-binding protein 1A [unclassified Roseitalea]